MKGREGGKKEEYFFIYLILAIETGDKVFLLMNTEKPEGVASVCAIADGT